MLLFSRIILCVAGVLLLLIGAGILFTPHAFFATNGVVLGHEPSLMSEIRAPGGLLFGCAVVMLIGVARTSVTWAALKFGAIVYGSYGAARFFSMAIDGMPSFSLVGAAILEILIGALCIVPLLVSQPESVVDRQMQEA